jgi:hypothetical protein
MAANLGPRMVTTRTRSLPNHRRADRSSLARPLVRKRDVDPTALRKFPISRGNPGAVRELCGIVGATALRPDRGLSGWYGSRTGADDLWVLPKPRALRPGFVLPAVPSPPATAQRFLLATADLAQSPKYRAPLRPSRFALLRKPRAEAAPLWTPSSQIERQPRNERRLAMRGWCGA